MTPQGIFSRCKLLRDRAGSMAIETAFVVPVLAMISIGAFETSTMVARQTELQTAADEAAQIALVAPPTDQSAQNKLEDIIEASAELADNKVAVSRKYRCGIDDGLVNNANQCAESDPITGYIQIDMTDTYTPVWTQFGIGSAIEYNVTRTVLVG